MPSNAPITEDILRFHLSTSGVQIHLSCMPTTLLKSIMWVEENVAKAEAAGQKASSVNEDQLFMVVVKEYGYLKKGRPYMIGIRTTLSTDGSCSSTVRTSPPPMMT